MASLKRLCFLVVDDNHHMVSIIKTILRGFGAEKVVEARDAVEAFDLLRSNPIDIVIVDYMMPVLDGIEFVKLVRTSSDSSNLHIPIIMLTAHSERSRVIAARDAGITEFCAKPVTANELYRKIREIVNSPRAFIKTHAYFGPDRRRKVEDFPGEDRRSSNAQEV
ncbi:response regulator [Asticcacaulis sp. BYS171W]|uniref:Response regulator n=1 Tax=Asticcacaulis aquaticus TaxID=2984212 RepID=A0ABT5HTS0_9CAUL|nr:response regulator [Asticcacaulis aquaticus]MDC7683317.1 response regulator [Asticcacaulis aquaticus]